MDTLNKNQVKGGPTLRQILFVARWLDKYNIPYYRADIKWRTRPDGTVYMFEVESDKENLVREINSDPGFSDDFIPQKVTIRFSVE